jgi:hypothetical protein
MKLSERGATSVVMVCAVVFGLGLVASVVLNLLQAQRAADDKAQLQGQITDLTYQVEQDHKKLAGSTVTSPTPSVSPTPSASPSPSATPAVLGSQTIKLTELGVSVTVSDPVGDLVYKSQPKNGVSIVGLTTASLNAKYPKCVASFLGQISKRADGAKANTNETLIKSIGGNSYYYIKPVVECATDAAGKALRANLVNTIQASVLPTLQ